VFFALALAIFPTPALQPYGTSVTPPMAAGGSVVTCIRQRGWDINAAYYNGGGSFTYCTRFDRVLARSGVYFGANQCARVGGLPYIIDITQNFRKRAGIQNYDNGAHNIFSVAIDFGAETQPSRANGVLPVEVVDTIIARQADGAQIIQTHTDDFRCVTRLVRAGVGGGLCQPQDQLAAGQAGVLGVDGASHVLAVATDDATTATLASSDGQITVPVVDGAAVFDDVSLGADPRVSFATPTGAVVTPVAS